MRLLSLITILLLGNCVCIGPRIEFDKEYLACSVIIETHVGTPGVGSGVAIFNSSHPVTIVTARHLIPIMGFVRVRSGSHSLDIFPPYRVSEKHDIAVLFSDDIEFANHLRPIALNTKIPKIGTMVWVVGNQRGEGLIPSFGPITTEPKFIPGYGESVGVGANAYFGSSGGGVFYNNKLIGIMSSVTVKLGTVLEHSGRFVPIRNIIDLVQP